LVRGRVVLSVASNLPHGPARLGAAKNCGCRAAAHRHGPFGPGVYLRPEPGVPLAVNSGLESLRYFYVAGGHSCGESAASTEAMMVSQNRLLEAAEPADSHRNPLLDATAVVGTFSYGSQPEGTYWACLFLQRTGGDERAAAVVEESAVVTDSPSPAPPAPPVG
jgi:hypothetical protein